MNRLTDCLPPAMRPEGEAEQDRERESREQTEALPEKPREQAATLPEKPPQKSPAVPEKPPQNSPAQTASTEEPPAQTTPGEETPAQRKARLAHEAGRIAFYNAAEGSLQRRDGVDCPVCRNKGYFYRMSEDGYMVTHRCGCADKREVLRRIRESGLQSLIRSCTFATFETTQDWQRTMKDAAEAFCRDPDAHWFYAGGQVGCGKTHICTAICEYYIRKGYDVRYLMWAETAKHLKAMVNDYRAYTDLINGYKRIPVLYIDDFLKVRQGAEPSDGDLNLAFELVNARLLRPEAITVISSEKTLKEAMEYDEATFSRIFQKSGKYNLSIGREQGRNYRLREA